MHNLNWEYNGTVGDSITRLYLWTLTTHSRNKLIYKDKDFRKLLSLGYRVKHMYGSSGFTWFDTLSGKSTMSMKYYEHIILLSVSEEEHKLLSIATF